MKILNINFLTFYILHPEISELCNSEFLFSLNAPTGLPQLSFGPNWV